LFVGVVAVVVLGFALRRTADDARRRHYAEPLVERGARRCASATFSAAVSSDRRIVESRYPQLPIANALPVSELPRS